MVSEDPNAFRGHPPMYDDIPPEDVGYVCPRYTFCSESGRLETCFATYMRFLAGQSRSAADVVSTQDPIVVDHARRAVQHIEYAASRPRITGIDGRLTPNFASIQEYCDRAFFLVAQAVVAYMVDRMDTIHRREADHVRLV